LNYTFAYIFAILEREFSSVIDGGGGNRRSERLKQKEPLNYRTFLVDPEVNDELLCEYKVNCKMSYYLKKMIDFRL
jgi:hypothetical protein